MGKSSTTPNMAKLKGLAAKPSAGGRAVGGYEGDPEPGLDTPDIKVVKDRRAAAARSTARGEYDDSPEPAVAPPKKPRFPFIDSDEFLTADYRQEYLITKILVRGQPGVAAGPSKTLKTSIAAVEMGLSLAAGIPFLGQFDVPHRVRTAIVSGESGKGTLQETARRVVKARGIDPSTLPGWLQWCFDLPRFPDLANMTEFAKTLTAMKAEVVVIDPVYLCVGGEVDHANMFQMGATFKVVADVLLAAGVTPILIHHANRQLKPGEPMELMHLAYAGLDQFARQFLLLNRQSTYRGDGVHDLWFSAGGSAGHGGLWDLHIEEGVADEHFQGRHWDVTVRSPNEAQADQVDKREVDRIERNRAKMTHEEANVLLAIEAEVAAGQPGATRRKIRDRSGYGDGKVSEVITRLLEAGAVEEITFDLISGNNAKRTQKGLRRAIPR